jgi:hypothetical protein
VLAPPKAGRYTIRFGLVHEHVCWFQWDVGREVTVTRRLRVALSGDEAAVAHVLEQLTDEAPQFEPLVLASGGPPPRYGPPRAPDLRVYLLEGASQGRLRDLRLLAIRASVLSHVARRLRDGVPVRPLLRDAQGFLDEVGTCTHLLFAAGSPEVGTRELWLQAATAASARKLGVEVIVQEGALAQPSGFVDRLLVRSVLRHANVVPPNDLGLGRSSWRLPRG